MVRLTLIPVLGLRKDGVVEGLLMGREAVGPTRRAWPSRALRSRGRTARGASLAARAVSTSPWGGRLGLGKQILGAALELREAAEARLSASGRGRYALLGLLELTAAGAAAAARHRTGRRKDERVFQPEPIPEEVPGWSSDAEQIWAEAERVARERLGWALLGSVSHELRTPIASIRDYASSLRDTSGERFLPLGMEEDAWLAEIERNADRLRGLMDDWLDLSRLEAGVARMSFEWVEIDAVVDNLRPDLERIIEGRTLLTFENRAGASALVRCDVRFIKKLLTKLVENAAKFSPAESTIVVRIERYEGDVRIGVLDQGEGIPAEHQDKVFERFYQVEGAGTGPPRGAGLGLAICRRIVEAHGGSIWVESRAGWGSAFYAALPSRVSGSGWS